MKVKYFKPGEGAIIEGVVSYLGHYNADNDREAVISLKDCIRKENHKINLIDRITFKEFTEKLHRFLKERNK